MTFKLVGHGFAALALLTTSAAVQAADMRLKAPVYKGYTNPTYNWTGFYIGAQAGYAWGKSQHSVPVGLGGVFSGVAATDPFSVTGGLFGATVGYNYQMGNWVLGIEGDWSLSTKSGVGGSAISLLNPAFTVTTSEQWLATVRGRVGYAWDRIMVYGTGGWAAARVKVEDFSVTSSASDTQMMMGWTVGVGAEYAFLRNWSVKAEYLYVNFDPKTFLNPNSNPIVGVPHHVTLNNNIIRIGVNYKFGG